MAFMGHLMEWHMHDVQIGNNVCMYLNDEKV